MHSSLPCSILCQLRATTCGASVFFNLLLCWLTPPLSAWLIHILACFLGFEVVSSIAFPSSRTLLLMSQLFCHFSLIVMYDYLPPKCHQPVMVPLTLKLCQVCLSDAAGDVGLILLWQEESTEVVLFLWSFFFFLSNHEPDNSKHDWFYILEKGITTSECCFSIIYLADKYVIMLPFFQWWQNGFGSWITESTKPSLCALHTCFLVNITAAG